MKIENYVITVKEIQSSGYERHLYLKNLDMESYVLKVLTTGDVFKAAKFALHPKDDIRRKKLNMLVELVKMCFTPDNCEYEVELTPITVNIGECVDN